MNEDYLTSYFNDDFMQSMKRLSESINSFYQASSAIKSIDFTPILQTINELNKSNIFNSLRELPVYRPDADTIRILDDITSTISSLNMYKFNFPEINGEEISAIEEEEIYSEENENKETTKPIIYSHDLDSWKKYQDNKYLLYFALLNYNVALQRFNEVSREIFHKGYSYISDRKIAVWGLSNALSTVIALLVSINPTLPILVFSTFGVFGLFEPKDK